MKNFVWGFISALVLVGLVWGIYKLIPGFKKAKEANRQESLNIECQNINSSVREYGSLKLQILYKGQPATDLETDIAQVPGPDNYCSKITDSNGNISINNMPIGNYYVYFNMSNYPAKYGIASTQVKFEIKKDTVNELSIDLDDYQK